ncbi:amidase family protein [Ectobacillus ponti]|uniref:Amidase family protein n=1 Tax=Ectobacillus ponti TaxID=2961894 RepID=A0AA41XD87_9BACI|nr:amidase family protein [Ectobacillus ponti]MCP8970733.1 amidase family protein [Ectobacillus ponti]
MHNPKLQALAEEWLVETTIADLQEALEAGKVTSRDLVLMYMSRISTYDKGENGINSVLELNPDALHIAEALDAERKQRGVRGPLHGIPLLLKDNIDTGDRMHTSAGSLALAEHVAAADSFVAEQLREAGAVLLGKVNMTEWANFMTENMPNGYSSRGGQVKNPYGPFDVGGSSSGSGASIAANLAAAAIGTETSGSILSPASSNSIVGIKPTVGLVSRSGIIPIAHSQDTAGPMARTVSDAAVVLSALTKQDGKDPATLKNPEPGLDYTTFLKQDGLQGKRIGISRHTFQYLNEEQLALMEAAIRVLDEQGATVIEDVVIPSETEESNYEVLIYEFKAALNAYLRTVGPRIPVHSLRDVLVFNEQNRKDALKHGQTLLAQSELTSGTLTEPSYMENRERDLYLSQENGIDAALAAHQLDLLVSPHYYGSALPAKAGYPSVTVPAGYTSEGEPLGITFTAGAFTESVLIEAAYAFEQATRHRKPPVLG